MNRDVLISLYNKYWEGMCNGEKEWEVRKNHPGTTSFTAYIYETRSNGGSGKIVGKIEVDFIVEFTTPIDLIDKKTMLSLEELYGYAGGKALYGWHISNVERFQKPLDLLFYG